MRFECRNLDCCGVAPRLWCHLRWSLLWSVEHRRSQGLVKTRERNHLSEALSSTIAKHTTNVIFICSNDL